MDLSRLAPAPGATKKRKRVGRGPGSGHGKTATRGHKGRGSRSGGNTPPGYEGGQMPLQRRLPKRGFYNPFRVEYSIVNLAQLEAFFDAGSVVDDTLLRARSIIKGPARPLKILAKGTVSKAFTVRANKFSDAAKKQLKTTNNTIKII